MAFWETEIIDVYAFWHLIKIYWLGMMESHRSGLQTAQDYTHSDPALRHQANKEAMQRFYQELQ